MIKDYYKENNFDFLLTAHHLDDQAETFFIRLFRGSGIDGLASMSEYSTLYDMNIIRPFLGLHKSDLQEYLVKKGITWAEDESNSDEKYFRNKVRAFLSSFENKNEIVERVDFAIKEIGKMKEFISGEFEKYKKLLNFNSFGTCLFSYEKIKKVNSDMGLRLLAYIAQSVSGNVYKPRLEKLKRLYSNILNITKEDKFKMTFYGCVFEKYGNDLIIAYREYNAIGDDLELIFGKDVVWDDRFMIKLLSDKKNVHVGHVREGEFTTLLRQIRKTDPEKYKELKNVLGIEKNIFYTLPIVKVENEYVLDCRDVDIKFLPK
jgi:tRNA(Ile)-lysidine synthase